MEDTIVICLLITAFAAAGGGAAYAGHLGSEREDNIRLECMKRGHQYQEGQCRVVCKP